MTFEVGNKLDGWCGRCKLMLRHTIEAMAVGKILRVHCNTCGAQHAQRAKAPRGSQSPISHERRYQSLLRGRTDATSTPYSTTARFAVGELISHTTFGLGVITGARDSVKIDILFAGGAKACERDERRV